MKKVNNELDINGSMQSLGDLNIGNSIEKQVNITISNPNEQQLREIIKNEVELILSQQQIVAEDKAREKLLRFSETILPKLVKAEMLDAFSDPTVQMFYRTAQQTAICSERDIDYSVLSELLVYRINNKGNIAKKASITKAAEILDKITDEALLAITIKYCTSFSPIIGNIQEGLEALENLFKRIIDNSKLPTNNSWIDNVEILNIVRIESLKSMNRFDDIYFNSLSGYVSKGIEKNSQLHADTLNKLKENDIPIDILVEHYLNPNYVRLNISSKEQIVAVRINRLREIGNGQKTVETLELSQSQQNVLKEIFETYEKDKSFNNIIKETFVNKINEYPTLRMVKDWWNSNLQPAMLINSIGRVLAHTNAKRLFNDIPDMV